MTLSQIQNKIYFLTKTNVNQLSNANMVILINNAYERVVSLILEHDKRWQWDDTNNTDFPIATTNLVSSQQDYTLAVTHLKILRVEAANSSGVFSVLDPYDEADEHLSLSYLSTITGIPTRYDVLGSSILLDPKPGYNSTNGLKIYFQRGPTLFSTGDLSTGTLSPGFNSLFHDLIPLWSSYDYAMANGLKNANQIMVEIARKEEALKTSYASRDKNDKDVMTIKKIKYI